MRIHVGASQPPEYADTYMPTTWVCGHMPTTWVCGHIGTYSMKSYAHTCSNMRTHRSTQTLEMRSLLHVSAYYYYACVRILLYTCHTHEVVATCVRILLYVSAYRNEVVVKWGHVYIEPAICIYIHMYVYTNSAAFRYAPSVCRHIYSSMRTEV
jgi:hypothetical protein